MAQVPLQFQGDQEPVKIQPDSECLRSVLKEFFDPRRTNNPRTDFYAVYRKESGEFDRDNAKKYDEDLNTSLIFAGLFSAVSSAFIVDVQSKLEQNPNDRTAAYMRILVHNMNKTLFPDADPSDATWTGPPPDIVAVQAVLYTSLATSLFAAFLTMLGKQWINRYTRNRGGSAAEKSHDRQRKLDGLEEWRFYIVIESIPILLQLALLLLGCALSLRLWKISLTVAGVILTFTLTGVALYTLFTLAPTFHNNCPYRTPFSTPTRALFRYLKRIGSAFARSLRSLARSFIRVYFSFVNNPEVTAGHPHAGAHTALGRSGGVPGPSTEHIQLDAEPQSFFRGISVNLEICKADARCIWWLLDSTTDYDVIFSTVQFAVDTVWHPEIADTLSPDVLKDLFHECLLNGRVVHGRLEHTSVIGMALASVLSTQLIMEPERPDLRDLCRNIKGYTDWVFFSESTFLPGVAILRIVLQTPENFQKWEILSNIPDDLPTTHKLCLSRLVLQTIWRWRREGHAAPLNLKTMELFCKRLMANGDHTLLTLKTNCYLIMAISLGCKDGDFRDLFIPDKEDVLVEAINAFHKQLQVYIASGETDLTLVLSTLNHLDPFRATSNGHLGLKWIAGILESKYPDRYLLAGEVAKLLENDVDTHSPPRWHPSLQDFLSWSEKFYIEGCIPNTTLPTIEILLRHLADGHFGPTLLPILVSTLPQNGPLQSRSLALKIFHRFTPGWFSPQMEIVPDEDRGALLRAVGDPFKFPDLPPQHAQPEGVVDYEPMMVAVALIEFASSDLWKNHLTRSNLNSCEKVVSTEEGRRTALECMANQVAHTRSEVLRTPAKIVAAIKCLEELQCLNIADVVILRAWTTGVVDDGALGLIESVTLEYYQTHGLGRLTALQSQLTDTNEDPISDPLSRLYHLFREEMVAVGGMDGKAGVPSGRSVAMPVQPMDWLCDCPWD